MTENEPPATSEPALSWIAEIRGRLLAPPPRRLALADVRPASVLVPLFVDAGELWTLLTVRSAEMPTHKSQVAFPGGGRETGEKPWDAALREAEEEIGLDRKTVVQLGELDEASTPSGFTIVPCVGAVPSNFQTQVNDEISEAFKVPLSAFANIQVVEDRRVRIDGIERDLRIYHVGRRRIWGVTARIIQSLMVRLGVDSPFRDEVQEPWRESPDAPATDS